MNQELNEVECKSLKKVVVVDNTTLGAEEFGNMLDREGLGKERDFRNLLAWEGNGVVELEGEELDAGDGELIVLCFQGARERQN